MSIISAGAGQRLRGVRGGQPRGEIETAAGNIPAAVLSHVDSLQESVTGSTIR